MPILNLKIHSLRQINRQMIRNNFDKDLQNLVYCIVFDFIQLYNI